MNLNKDQKNRAILVNRPRNLHYPCRRHHRHRHTKSFRIRFLRRSLFPAPILCSTHLVSLELKIRLDKTERKGKRFKWYKLISISLLIKIIVTFYAISFGIFL